MIVWDVYLKGEYFDSVLVDPHWDEKRLKESLVGDGFPAGISVRFHNKWKEEPINRTVKKPKSKPLTAMQAAFERAS